MGRLLFVLAMVVAAAAAEVAEYQTCDTPNGEPAKCTISEVRISPCTSKKLCRLKKGTDANISVDFSPDFTASKLKSSVFWASNVGDVPWVDLDTDACKGTSCPTEAGKSQLFNYSLHLGKKLPEGKFTFKWNVYDEADETKVCCFKTTIQIRK